MPAAKVETLPSMERIQAVEDKVSSARSDLDMFLHTLRLIDGPSLSDTEREANWKLGGIDAVIEAERAAPFAYDPETFARLLVLAGDLREDADALGKEARRLQDLLARVYRDRVLEPGANDEAKGGDDD